MSIANNSNACLLNCRRLNIDFVKMFRTFHVMGRRIRAKIFVIILQKNLKNTDPIKNKKVPKKRTDLAKSK